MRGFEHGVTIQWGDCDAMGIVYYPNYFRWMDESYHALAASCGYSQRSLPRDHGVAGTPLVDARFSFRAPASYGDRLTYAVSVQRLGATSMTLGYRVTRGAVLVAEGVESRAFVRETADGIAKTPIPDAVRQALLPHLVEPH